MEKEIKQQPYGRELPPKKGLLTHIYSLIEKKICLIKGRIYPSWTMKSQKEERERASER